jgi:penicillin V acylase-like amidase (Ntn superfamily)
MCTVIKVTNDEKNVHVVARFMEFEVDTKSENSFFSKRHNRNNV